jgi:hypothetical protein
MHMLVFSPEFQRCCLYTCVCVLLAQFLLEVRFVFAYLNGIRGC